MVKKPDKPIISGGPAGALGIGVWVMGGVLAAESDGLGFGALVCVALGAVLLWFSFATWIFRRIEYRLMEVRQAVDRQAAADTPPTD